MSWTASIWALCITIHMYFQVQPTVSQRWFIQSAQLKPSSISTVEGISVDTGPSTTIINNQWHINVNTQQGSDLMISTDARWGFHPEEPSSIELLIQGSTSNTTFHNDGEILFVFNVNNQYFAEMVSMDTRRSSYKECPASNDVLITRDVTEMINSLLPDRFHRFCKNDVNTPINDAVDFWSNVQGIYKLPTEWPMFITITNDPVTDIVTYTWTDAINGLNKVTSHYTSQLTADQGMNIYISGDSGNEAFSIHSIDVKYKYDLGTLHPTVDPTKPPTPAPTMNPTSEPTTNPTAAPTNNPTPAPTTNPTPSPTTQPTHAPSNSPTPSPTPAPTPSPTPAPTGNPTPAPTLNPSSAPTSAPTLSPSSVPTLNPTSAPTLPPSSAPSTAPTPVPTFAPSFNPTYLPTDNPTPTPSSLPTISTNTPSLEPSDVPTMKPTSNPSVSPTLRPSISPTHRPSVHPTHNPSFGPTDRPTLNPSKPGDTRFPTTQPTPQPTFAFVIKEILKMNGTKIVEIYAIDNNTLTITWPQVMVIMAAILLLCIGLIGICSLIVSKYKEKEDNARRETITRDDDSLSGRTEMSRSAMYRSESALYPKSLLGVEHQPLGNCEGSRRTTDTVMSIGASESDDSDTTFNTSYTTNVNSSRMNSQRHLGKPPPSDLVSFGSVVSI